MKYLLADALVYNDEDGTVTPVNAPEEDAQLLTCTANTILKLLVKHHGNVIERETFLREVWDKRGLQGSNNSLNQYISILRKMLASLLPDVLFIVTVPKTGFMLCADVTVTALEEEVPAAETAKPAWTAVLRRAHAGYRRAVRLDNGRQARSPAERNPFAHPYWRVSGLHLYAAGRRVSREGGCAGANPSARRSFAVPEKFNLLHAHSENAVLRSRRAAGAIPMLPCPG